MPGTPDDSGEVPDEAFSRVFPGIDDELRAELWVRLDDDGPRPCATVILLATRPTRKTDLSAVLELIRLLRLLILSGLLDPSGLHNTTICPGFLHCPTRPARAIKADNPEVLA